MRIVDIDSRLDRSTPYIRVYRGRISINAPALQLLKVQPGIDRIVFRHDLDSLSSRKTFTAYIARSNDGTGYEVRPKRHIGRICSVSLSEKLATYLTGYAAYRIINRPVYQDGIAYYPIDPKSH